jgi:thioredoxin reductase (NADPH)
MSAEQGGVRDVVIVGSGPAGWTAAIYAARARLAPIVLEGETISNNEQPGGQLMATTEVENYPGFVDGVMGPVLMTAFRAQAERFDAEIVTKRATRIETDQWPFRIWTDSTNEDEPDYRARALILATGARSLLLGVPGEDRLLGYGVSTCATCDGFFFRDKKIAVVGGGDSAIEEALFLTRFGDSVTVIHRRKELRASKIMQDRAFRNDKISFLLDSVPTEIFGEGRVSGARVRNVITGEETDLPFDGVFVAIGHAPNTELLAGKVDLDPAGYIITHEGSHTSIPGVFACGDVQDHVYRQAVTAAGSGCMAAIDAERYLESLDGA